MLSSMPPPGLASFPGSPGLVQIKEEIRAMFTRPHSGLYLSEAELDVLAREAYFMRSQEWAAARRGLQRGDLPVRESERLARMSLNRIWEQPSPYGLPTRAPFDYVNPTPPVIPSHVPLMEPIPRVPYADGSFPAQTLADVRPDVIDGHLFDLNHRFIPRTIPNRPWGDAYEPIWVQAPQLSHRTVENHQYAPQVYSAPISAPAASPKRTQTLNESLATWYAEQVALVLIEPGKFRPGASGAAEAMWGSVGREIDAWDRVGLPIPHYSHLYAKRAPVIRDPAYEAYDPYNVAWKNSPSVNDRMVTFITNLLQRMTIAPTAVISAVWYLHGLGLHEGDGEKGMVIRQLLRKESAQEDDGVEKRVALLGLMLSGKWLDDNAFLTSSWSEVSLIPKKDIDRLEFAALNDLHHSLHIPMASWSDFINLRWAELLPGANLPGNLLFPLVDKMVTDARNNELWEPVKPMSRTKAPVAVEYYDYVDRKLEEMYYADQAEEDEYPPRSRGSTPVSQWSFPQALPRAAAVDEDMEDAARNVSALVDDEMEYDYDDFNRYDEEEVEQVVEEVAESEDESEDEFLDYDGAKRFLPTISELRRSISNSSAQSDAIAEWRAGIVHSAPVEVESFPSPQVSVYSAAPSTIPSTLPPSNMPNFDIPSSYDDWSRPRDHTRITSSEARCEPFDHDAYASLGRRGRVPHVVPTQVRTKPQPIPANVTRTTAVAIPIPVPAPTPAFKPTGVYLEPGIAQVRPSQLPRLPRQPLNALTGVENMDAREAAVMAYLNPSGYTVRSRWDSV